MTRAAPSPLLEGGRKMVRVRVLGTAETLQAPVQTSGSDSVLG